MGIIFPHHLSCLLWEKPRKPQEKSKGTSSVLKSADSHDSCIYKLLFIQRISRDISVESPKNFHRM